MNRSAITICVILISAVIAAVCIDGDKNDTPIIGVLAQEIAYSLNQKYPDQYDSFIAASYVKFVEGGGARVIPVWIGRDKAYYQDVINKTNGLLFPGGATWFNQSCGYSEAGSLLMKLAKEQNDRGDYYPIFGTCLGMELLIFAELNGVEPYRTDCEAMNIGLPLTFKPDFKSSKMFKKLPKLIENDLKTKNITSNFHRFCVTEEILQKQRLTDAWHVLSVNKDVNGLEFISTLESRRYPFFGVQFHPEKHIYEWKPKTGISHSKSAIAAAQYFAQMFVNEARKSTHRYDSRNDEQTELIYNYPMKYTGRDGSLYEQCYLFEKDNSVCPNFIDKEQ